MSAPRKPLWFTFGNHMHWVDMQWLWGYQVLPDSIDDMLALCDAVGAKANVNFDGVGYEKLAAEAPEALARLRAAIAAGTVEVVGASYGQPYGLFFGGESNLRQRILGARTARRLLGVWPRSFWEEEFDFFPQLPQMLKGCGFTGACLFFQWTWHTPQIPDEAVPLVRWEGIDGTRLPTVAKTALCLHQWPEDFDGRLELAQSAPRPALVQWLELMPSKDWMCRSELLLPRLRELFADPRFEVRAATLGELIAAFDEREAPLRRYTMDDVFHGMTIGKNGDAVPRQADRVEARILAAESSAATAGLLGRPYASWDVYPAWELDEAWRELCAAQHHDNHECEGLCGSIGKTSLARAELLARDVLTRTREHLARHVQGASGELLVFNDLGFERDVTIDDGRVTQVVTAVPAFGWKTVTKRVAPPPTESETNAESITLRCGSLGVTVDRRRGRIESIRAGDLVLPACALQPTMRRDGRAVDFGTARVTAVDDATLAITHDHGITSTLRLRPDLLGVQVDVRVRGLPRPDPGFAGALRMHIGGLAGVELVHDTPCAVDSVRARGRHVRKYPSGDWMTSPQWFEDVVDHFTARSFVDLLQGERGLLCVHDGSQGWFRSDDGVEVVLNAYDPWDEDRWQADLDARFVLVPHGPMSHAQRLRIALAARAPAACSPMRGDGSFPSIFGALCCEPAHVHVSAFHREHRKAFEHVDDAFGPQVRNPYVVRLVEYDGAPAEVVLRVPGSCASAARTDHLGRVQTELRVEAAEPPAWSPPGLTWSALRFPLRPREIATVMLDLELGRHQPRNLDQHRSVWATVHRR
ncbi:MAG: hypothetical protein U1F36_23450 [Planctomycetota bacterium]